MTVKQQYDTIIIGGSCAGLSAALVLGRSLRRVLVIDAGQPANRQTPHSHGFLSRDGATPAELSAISRQQVSQYPTVQFWSAKVIAAELISGGFSVTTGNGVQFQERKLLLATGVFDIMPDLPGFAECWGRSVLHCPYCHGYEVHSQSLGVFGNGDVGVEFATLIHHWSNQVTLFTNGPATLTTNQRQLLGQLNISIIETPIVAIDHEAGLLTALLLADGSRAHPKSVFARVPFRQHTDIATQLGCSLTDNGLIEATEFGNTNVSSVFAAGDIMTPFRQVATAVANGAKAGVWINSELMKEDVHQQTQLGPINT